MLSRDYISQKPDKAQALFAQKPAGFFESQLGSITKITIISSITFKARQA